MKKTLALLFAIGMVSALALATEITIDYAHDFDFVSVKTFEYVQTVESNAPDQITDGRIRAAIIRELTEGGLTRVESDPDLFVTYHLTSEDDTIYDTSFFGYSTFGDGWGGWGAGMGATAATLVSAYKKGTLVVDAFRPDDKKIVWRATGSVPVNASPEKQSKQVDKIMKDLGKRWRKILDGKGK